MGAWSHAARSTTHEPGRAFGAGPVQSTGKLHGRGAIAPCGALAESIAETVPVHVEPRRGAEFETAQRQARLARHGQEPADKAERAAHLVGLGRRDHEAVWITPAPFAFAACHKRSARAPPLSSAQCSVDKDAAKVRRRAAERQAVHGAEQAQRNGIGEYLSARRQPTRAQGMRRRALPSPIRSATMLQHQS